MKKGLTVIISGPSGVGKDAVKELVLAQKDLHLFPSISVTTRPKRDHEVDGSHYYFTDYETFAESVKNREFIEYQEFLGHHYGTPRLPEEFLRKLGKNTLISVEAQGALQAKHEIPDALSFYLMPKSLEDLERIIRVRGHDDEAAVVLRLNKAQLEMKLGSIFDYEVPIENCESAANFIIEKIRETLSKA